LPLPIPKTVGYTRRVTIGNRQSAIGNFKMSPEICPNCGAIVPSGAKCCPECGADENSGWSESACADRLGIPDDNFDYNKFVKEEFGPEPVKPRGIHWVWWMTGIALILAFLIFYLR
jgi:RNA polymerase subunit RPABC4/transcription elongation factor Spt4